MKRKCNTFDIKYATSEKIAWSIQRFPKVALTFVRMKMRDFIHIWNMKRHTCTHIYVFVQIPECAHTRVFTLRSGKPKRSGKPRPQAFAAVGNAASVVIQIYGGNARNSKREKGDEKKKFPPPCHRVRNVCFPPAGKTFGDKDIRFMTTKILISLALHLDEAKRTPFVLSSREN